MTFTPASREELGLPAGGNFHRLLFNESAQTTIVAMEVPGSHTSLGRLYWRKRTWPQYRPVPPPAEDFSLHGAVTGFGAKLFFLATRFFPTAAVIGGDNPLLGVFDLRKGRSRYLRLFFEDGTDRPIGELTGVSHTGRELFCSVGFREKGSMGTQMVYRMCRLNLASGEVTPLTLLAAVFY